MTPIDLATAVFAGNMAAAGTIWAVIQFEKHGHKAPFGAYGMMIVAAGFFLSIALSDEDPTSFLDPEGASASVSEPSGATHRWNPDTGEIEEIE